MDVDGLRVLIRIHGANRLVLLWRTVSGVHVRTARGDAVPMVLLLADSIRGTGEGVDHLELGRHFKWFAGLSERNWTHWLKRDCRRLCATQDSQRRIMKHRRSASYRLA